MKNLIPLFVLMLLAFASGLLEAAPAPARTPPKYDLSNEGVARMLKDYPKDEDVILEMFLTALERKPTEGEVTQILAFIKGAPNKPRQAAYEDIAWLLTNSQEYLKKQKTK